MISMPASQQNVYLPSKEEIHQRCQEIQMTWSPAEKDRRRGLFSRRTVAPRVVVCHLDSDELEYAS